MSLEQNDKKIKSSSGPEAKAALLNKNRGFKAILTDLIFASALSLLIVLLILLIWQLVLLNNSYNLSNRSIAIEKSQRVGEISQDLSPTYPITDKTYSKNFYIAASKNGTKYYYQNCTGLGRIKPENLTFFASERQAEGVGYTLAKNCQKPQK